MSVDEKSWKPFSVFSLWCISNESLTLSCHMEWQRKKIVLRLSYLIIKCRSKVNVWKKKVYQQVYQKSQYKIRYKYFPLLLKANCKIYFKIDCTSKFCRSKMRHLFSQVFKENVQNYTSISNFIIKNNVHTYPFLIKLTWLIHSFII